MNDLLPEKSRVWRNLEKKSRLFLVTMVLMRFDSNFGKNRVVLERSGEVLIL